MILFDRILKPLFWAALIFAYVAAILPQADVPRIAPSDKVEHMIAFFTLSLLAGLAWRRTAPWRIAAALAAFGAAIEFTQAIPVLHRDASAADFAADALAIIVGLGIATLVRNRSPREA
ncbi:hypothetical protein ACFB49_18440 [Sphingomonas sp. DBB INV C78]|uniref:teicoplanin resistance protein VanZ n=1 Tax=Sphingomonas sp. DBB INV C78 TaxID=3349434 RepID=UPI0036D3601E